MTMERYNAGKPPVSLIPTSFFEAIFNHAFEAGVEMPVVLLRHTGDVLGFGAQKYNAHNWRKGGSWSSVMNSALRHLVFRMIPGATIDPESNLSEAGHLGCNIAFLLEFATQGLGDDDRFIVEHTHQAFEAIPEPSLIWVLSELLAFRDGGGIEHLQSAAYELARWVELQGQPPAPAAPLFHFPTLQ
ncbi:dATP/dGTP diphosphohydrolase domain-containing protein [Rhizobium arsenicireducens]